MKYLLIFLISFNVFSQTKIEVFEGKKLIAGDSGKSVSIVSLRKKMIKKKGIDILNDKYNVIETDLSIIKTENSSKKVLEANELISLRNSLSNISDPVIKKALVRIFKDYYKKKGK